MLKSNSIPRLPLDGRFDLTYRCNNNCIHCWLKQPDESQKSQVELNLEEIKNIVDQARAMGCQAWSISGGEPMLRPDFYEIFDYITHKSVHYKLNTNGTLITPKIAHLIKRRGQTMVALYGATAEIHDFTTRTPGSFDAVMQGLNYLKEAGANFTIQIVPMRANYHQIDSMMKLAKSLSKYSRIGAPWLWLSSCHQVTRNREIIEQRLDPTQIVQLNKPHPASQYLQEIITNDDDNYNDSDCHPVMIDDRLFAKCIANRRDFHIDPYGGMSFCSFIKDPQLRFNLRQVSFQEVWDNLIPSLVDVVRGGQEYWENCGSCELRNDCFWCPVYGYLEHGRYSAKVEYLCQIAQETRRFKQAWKSEHLRYYQIGGVSIMVSSDVPINDKTFNKQFEKFRIQEPGNDAIAIELIPRVPPLSELKLGERVYHKIPWSIYRQYGSWVYVGIGPEGENEKPHTLAIVNDDYSHMTIYCYEGLLQNKALNSLTAFTTDQILFAPLFANRQAFFMHSAGIILNGKGFLFVGHSDAGKSTMLKMLRGQGEILCDDRIIVRRWPEGFRIHGTWSHGELPDVSSESAPLSAILILKQAKTNELIPITNKQERLGKVLSHIIKSLATEDWWDKTLKLADDVSNEVPIYDLRFDLSGQVKEVLKQLYE